MTARRVIFGLCAICTTLLGAFTAQSALAVSQTAVTCATTGTQIAETEKFADAHCKTKNGTTGPNYHVAFAEETEGELINETTEGGRKPFFLEYIVGGLGFIFEAKKVLGKGTIKNGETGGEMFAEAKTNKLVFEEVAVTNRNCEFIGVNPGGSETVGKMETQPLAVSTKGQSLGVVRIEPQAGSTSKFAEFKLAGASCPVAFVGSYPVFGTVLSNAAEGATVPIVHNTVTSEPAPKLRLNNPTSGVVMGMTGTLTVRAGNIPSTTAEWNPIALT
jgi:hypothetical protein